MSQENVEIVRRGYDLWNQGDMEAWAEPEEFFESGDQVVAVVTGRLRHKDSSTEIENRVGHLWTIREGAVASMRIFPQEKALEALRLRE